MTICQPFSHTIPYESPWLAHAGRFLKTPDMISVVVYQSHEISPLYKSHDVFAAIEKSHMKTIKLSNPKLSPSYPQENVLLDPAVKLLRIFSSWTSAWNGRCQWRHG